MKKVLLSSLALCLIVSSCSNNLIDGQLGRGDSGAVVIPKDSINLRPEVEFTLEKIKNAVREEPLIYGNDVQVFASYAEFDSTLNLIEEMTPAQLKTWATEHNIESDIIESNAMYDEVFRKIGLSNGVRIDKDGLIILPKTKSALVIKIHQANIERTLAQFDSVMHAQYPQYLHEFTDSLGEHYIEPLSAPNEQIFRNDKNLFIIDNEVHRTYADGSIVCNFSDYKKIAKYNSIKEIKQLQRDDISMQSSNWDIKYHTQYNERILSGKGTDSNSRHRLVASFSLSVTRALFGLDRRSMRVLVTNYEKNKRGNWVSKSCKTDLTASFSTTAVGGSNHTFTFNHKNCCMRNRQFTHFIYTKSAGDVYITSFTATVKSGGAEIINK